MGDASGDLAIQRTGDSVEITVLRKEGDVDAVSIKTIFVNLPQQSLATYQRLIFPPRSARLHDAIHSHDEILRRSGLGDKSVSA